LSYVSRTVDHMLNRTKTYGEPGTSAHRLARRRSIGASALMALAVVVATLLAVAGAPLPAVVVLGAGWSGRRLLWSRSGRAIAGAHAEIATARLMRRVPAAVIVYNARLPGRRDDVDVIMLGPMAAAIEIKRGSGRVRWYADGRVRVDGHMLPGRPLRQAIAQAVATRRALGMDGYVDAVLCVADMKNRPRLTSIDGVDVWITSARHLRRVLKRLPHQLDRGEATDLAVLLE
jgi:hypothetical protein